MAFAVGIGLTNECNLRCGHCYRPDSTIDHLSLEDVRTVCESIPVRSVNLGVGENGLHPAFETILDYLWAQRLTTTITSNGLSIQRLDDTAVRRFHSIEFSLDFPTEHEHDAFRGRGNWRTVMAAAERCMGLGVPVTITAVMMRNNYDRLGELAKVAGGLGADLRVNVYQPAKNDRFTLTYGQFWEGWMRLFGTARLVVSTEPVLVAALGLQESAAPGCGRSTVRVAPDGRVLPCTYWPESQLTIADLTTMGEAIVTSGPFEESRTIPVACKGCPCGGGCAGRRRLLGDGRGPDPYCPFVRGDRIAINWEPAERVDLPKAGSACTTVVSAR